jgi:adenylate cyclase
VARAKSSNPSAAGAARRRARFVSQSLTGLIIALALVTLTRFGFLAPLQFIWYDALVSVQDQPPSPHIKLVTITEPDFRAWGEDGIPEQFPRAMLAAIIQRLVAAEAAVIVVDLFLDKPGDPAGDRALRAALGEARAQNVPVLIACDARRAGLKQKGPFDDLAARACANLRLGPRHEVRWLDPALRTEGGSVPALSALASEKFGPRLQALGLTAPARLRHPVPVRFWAKGSSFEALAAREVFGGPRPPGLAPPASLASVGNRVRDGVVFIGRADSGSQDEHWAPIQQGAQLGGRRSVRMMGLEVQANCLATLLSHPRPRMELWADALAAALAALATSFLLVCLGLRGGSLASTLVVLVGGTWISMLVFSTSGYVVNLAPVWLALLLQAYFSERGERHRYKQWLGAMVSDSVARDLGQTLDPVAGEGQVRPVAVLNFDLRKSTQTAARLAPEEVGPAYNQVLAVVCEVVLEHGGIVNKFLGDGLLACWLPGEAGQEAAAQQALHTARELPLRLAVIAGEWQQQIGEPLRYGISAHWGDAWVGFVGTPQRLEFTALGSVVNEVYKIQGVAAETGGLVLVTQNLLAAAGHLQQARVNPAWGPAKTWQHLVYYEPVLEPASDLAPERG